MTTYREVYLKEGPFADHVVPMNLIDGLWHAEEPRKRRPDEDPKDFPKSMTEHSLQSGSHNTHARLSPSDSKRWVYCTASIAFQEANAHRLPKDRSSRDSDLGTLAHDWAAKVLLGECDKEDLPEQFKDSVGAYIDYCRKHIPAGAGRTSFEEYEFLDAVGETPSASYHVEEQVALWYQPEQDGTSDFVVLSNEVVDVIDYKNGVGVLALAERSTQLAIYGYSFIKKFERFYSFNPETRVRLHIFQPNHREGADQPPWEISLGDLASFCWDIEMKAIAAREGANRVREKLGHRKGEDVSVDELLEAAPGLTFFPGEGDNGACRFCISKAICPKRFEASTEGLDFPDMDAAELLAAMPELDKTENKLPVAERITKRAEKLGISHLSDSYLVTLFARTKALKSFLEDVDEYLEGRALDGDAAPGTKLVDGREGNREWADEKAADTFLANQELSADQRYKPRVVISVTTAEKLLKGRNLSTKAKNRWNQLVTRSPGKKKLALAEDDREAVTAATHDTSGFDNEDDSAFL